MHPQCIYETETGLKRLPSAIRTVNQMITIRLKAESKGFKDIERRKKCLLLLLFFHIGEDVLDVFVFFEFFD